MDFYRIDMGTILIILVLGHLLTGILIVSYTVRHNKNESVNIFLLSKILQSLAWILLGLENTIPSLFLVGIANTVLYIGAACELSAFLILINSYNTQVKRVYVGLVIIGVLVYNLIVFNGASENIRVSISSYISAVLMIFPVIGLFKAKNSSVLQKIIAGFYGTATAFQLMRAYIALNPARDMAFWSTNIFNTGTFLVLYLTMLAGSIGFILLAKEKVDLEIVRAATFDELTNAFNRRTFILQAKELISQHAKKREPLSYLLIDIDDFKKINDRYGHYVGDITLKSFADTIRAQLRSYDLFGRYGGEEFAALLPGADQSESRKIAERLRKVIETLSVDAGSEVKYTISIGAVTLTPDNETTVDVLYKLSDTALYMAKEQGKNRVVSCVYV